MNNIVITISLESVINILKNIYDFLPIAYNLEINNWLRNMTYGILLFSMSAKTYFTKRPSV